MASVLESRVCLITGAAGGMGREIARVFADAGARLLLCDVRPPTGPLPDGADFIAFDVADERGWAAALQRAEDAFGGLDVLVNCAGLSGAVPADRRFGRAEWDRIMAINATAPFLGMTTAWPLLRRSSAASVVNISSIAGLVGMTGAHPAYAASKAALTLITKVMALEMAGDGIRVNSVHPGILPVMSGTGGADSGPAGADGGSAARAAADALRQQNVEANVPMKRLGSYEEVAQAVLFLAAAQSSSYITGSELVVDGGYTAR